jgi:hypothetical protein
VPGDAPTEVLFEVTFFDIATDRKMPNEALKFVQNQCNSESAMDSKKMLSFLMTDTISIID